MYQLTYLYVTHTNMIWYFLSPTLSSMAFNIPLSILFLSSFLSLSFSSGEPRTVSEEGSSSTPSSPCKGVTTAMFAFGDSTVDSGNNNFLPTTFRSNFPPYGRDFFDHVPTGRFSNGRLATDFAASYFGIKDQLPPYLDLSLGFDELLTGVSFASAGSGFDILTSHVSGVIPVVFQLGLFKTYQARLELAIGESKTNQLIERAIFFVSAGTNDFVANYFALPTRKKDFTIEEYQTFLLEKIRFFLKGLQEFGAKKIIVAGLPPMGCLPVVITLNWSGRFQERSCIEYFNNLSREFNSKLQEQLHNISYSGGAKISYADIYNPLINIISTPIKFGFRETTSGCCGTGLVEAAFLCNIKSLVCPNASDYVFWDSIHPTEKTYRIVFNALRPSIDPICK